MHAPTAAAPDAAALQSALAELFAPWVQALGLRVECVDERSVVLRLPVTPALARQGGMLCGQAMMAAADTAMVLALMRHFGQFRPCTTVQLNTSFLKPLRWSRRGCCGPARAWRSARSTCAAPATARACAAPVPPTPCCSLRLSLE